MVSDSMLSLSTQCAGGNNAGHTIGVPDGAGELPFVAVGSMCSTLRAVLCRSSAENNRLSQRTLVYDLRRIVGEGTGTNSSLRPVHLPTWLPHASFPLPPVPRIWLIFALTRRIDFREAERLGETRRMER
ncbi:uncharacterized protein ARMOST_12656 [Armillaria ostoyae]|uniref:Uncharacterized protein n=1 Tax=Armillaria ostoyae TaxID=47428 RepID=A0A284RKJ5_ARMOS|nr:uncharacterized protein ARMOST_12656 [Armillaria ostoyae]